MTYKDLHFEYIKGTKKSNIKFVLLHGWGHSLENLKPIALELFDYDCYLIDLAGFGKSPIPQDILSLQDYTKMITDFIKNTFKKSDKVYLIGHSFGGRISIYLARKSPELLNGIFVISGAGLKKKKSFVKKSIVFGAKLLRNMYKFLGLDIMKSKLYRKYYENFASQDYKNAKPIMREILKKTVAKDLSNSAKKITIPTVLIYGENDTVTPPYFGKKYHKLIQKSSLYILPTFNHNTILSSGKYQVSSIILNSIKE